MKFKTFISLLVAVSLGLAAVWVGHELIQGQGPSTVVSTGPMAQVVVAKHDLDAGSTINPAEDLTTIEMPTDKAPKSAFKDVALLNDRTVSSPVVAGQVMFEGLLAKVGADGGLVGLVPKGMRAVSVEVNESSGVSGLLVPGCHVDVIATLRQDSNGGQMARTIVEDVKVQAVGPRLTAHGDDHGQAAKTVTLIVTTKDAEAIELASTFGRPRLVLRGTADTDRTASTGVTTAELGGPTIPSAPVTSEISGWDRFFTALANHPASPQQPVRWPVQIIRGNNESTIFYDIRNRGGAEKGSEGDGYVASNPPAPSGSDKPAEKDVR